MYGCGRTQVRCGCGSISSHRAKAVREAVQHIPDARFEGGDGNSRHRMSVQSICCRTGCSNPEGFVLLQCRLPIAQEQSPARPLVWRCVHRSGVNITLRDAQPLELVAVRALHPADLQMRSRTGTSCSSVGCRTDTNGIRARLAPSWSSSSATCRSPGAGDLPRGIVYTVDYDTEPQGLHVVVARSR